MGGFGSKDAPETGSTLHVGPRTKGKRKSKERGEGGTGVNYTEPLAPVAGVTDFNQLMCDARGKTLGKTPSEGKLWPTARPDKVSIFRKSLQKSTWTKGNRPEAGCWSPAKGRGASGESGPFSAQQPMIRQNEEGGGGQSPTELLPPEGGSASTVGGTPYPAESKRGEKHQRRVTYRPVPFLSRKPGGGEKEGPSVQGDGGYHNLRGGCFGGWQDGEEGCSGTRKNSVKKRKVPSGNYSQMGG